MRRESGPELARLFGIMATPPTVLANAPTTSPAAVGNPAQIPVMPLLVAVVTGVVIAAAGIGGAVYALARAGRLPLQKAAGKAVSPPTATHLMVLDPLVVNLADGDGTAYLKVSMALQVEDGVNGKGSAQSNEKTDAKANRSESMIAARDTTLAVLGRQTSGELLAVDGKERLKDQLKAALGERNPDLKVVDIFFTDFLVQK